MLIADLFDNNSDKRIVIGKIFKLTGIVSVIVFVILIITYFLIINYIVADYALYDYNKIEYQGKTGKAKLVKIDIKKNININGYNLRVVEFNFYDKDQTITDYFPTIDIERIENIRKLDSIEIITYNNQSIIKNVTPYAFNYKTFLIGISTFLIVGSIFLCIGIVMLRKPKNIPINNY